MSVAKKRLFARESEAVEKLSAETSSTLELAEELCRKARHSYRTSGLRLLSPLPPLPNPPDDLKEASDGGEK